MKQKLVASFSKAPRVPSSIKALCVAAVAFAMAGINKAQAQAMAWDGTDLTFSVADAADDLYTLVLPIAAAGVGIYLVRVAILWIYSQLRKIGRG